MVNESLDLDDVKDVEVVVERRPWGEGDPRRPAHDARRFHDPKRLIEVGAGVPLPQIRQDRVAQRLDRGDHEQTAERSEFGKERAALQDVLHLRGEVERQLRELRVHGAHDRERVTRPVEEVRIAERDVGCADPHQPPDILEDDVLRDHEQSASVDRGNGTVEAHVQTAAAGFHVATRSSRYSALSDAYSP